MMTWWVVFLVFALVNWLSVEKGWRRVELVSKPLALVVLVLFFWQMVGWQGARLWFGLGLVFSLAGDIFLLWPKKFFIPGLAAFLAAHLCYFWGFNQDPLSFHIGALLVVVVAAAMGYSIYRTIRKGLLCKPETASLCWPVLAYTVIITLMVVSAWLCLLRSDWPAPAAWLAAMGASLFFISDTLLAYGMFVRPTAHNSLLVMITYHLGQAGILAGVLIRFAG